MLLLTCLPNEMPTETSMPQKSCSLGAKPWLQFWLPSDLPVTAPSPMLLHLYCFYHVCHCHDANRLTRDVVAALSLCCLGQAHLQLLLVRQVQTPRMPSRTFITLCSPSSLCFLSTTHSSLSKPANALVCNTSINLPLCPAL